MVLESGIGISPFYLQCRSLAAAKMVLLEVAKVLVACPGNEAPFFQFTGAQHLVAHFAESGIKPMDAVLRPAAHARTIHAMIARKTISRTKTSPSVIMAKAPQ